MPDEPYLVIFGGPNGSGKSTVFKGATSRIPSFYINADDIAKSKVASGDLNSVDEMTRNKINLEAANEADVQRAAAIKEGRSFTTESVMSTNKGIKIMNAAKENGFRVKLFYVLTDNPEINVTRIQNRVAKGGHPVPEDKIISRYNRCMELLPQEIQIADEAEVYDNSFEAPSLILEKTLDKEIRLYPQRPPSEWTRDRLEEIKTRVEAIGRREELIASTDEKGHISRSNEISVYQVQPDRVYSGEIIGFRDDSAIQEISPGVTVEHKGIASAMRQDDIGKRFSISYDNSGGVSITQERQLDRGNEIDR